MEMTPTKGGTRLSKIYFCAACGAPAKQMPGYMAVNKKPWWALTCAHAAPVTRMGPKKHAEVVAAHEQREEAKRLYIASCTGKELGRSQI